MRHAILGVGGVGGLVGAVLAKAGDDVTAIVRAEALASYPERLSLESALVGSLSVPVKRATAVTEAFDVLWIAVKATSLDASLDAVKDASRVGAIVPLLNGIDHMAKLRARFGDARVVPATIAVESERIAQGKIAHRSPFVALNVTTDGETRLADSLAKLRSFGFTGRVFTDEPTLLWSKLVFLAPIALTTSAAMKTVGEIAADVVWRARLERCLAEACAVAVASGARVDATRTLEAFAGLPPAMRSSMQKDVAAGQPPELGAIAGPILSGAARHGIDASTTRDLAERVSARRSP